MPCLLLLRPQDLPASVARDEDRTGEPCLGDGHQLHPDAARLRLSGGRRRRVQPAGAGPFHDGGGVLRRSARGSPGQTWPTRDLQHGPGSQFASLKFTGVLTVASVSISMDGKGAWRDNVFVERLWRTIKYEEVYLRAYDSVSEARASIARYLAVYNGRAPAFEP